jgi:hypothetical protein
VAVYFVGDCTWLIPTVVTKIFLMLGILHEPLKIFFSVWGQPFIGAASIIYAIKPGFGN